MVVLPTNTQETRTMPRRKSESLEEFQKKNLEKSRKRQ
jgi:hypothetical protein